MAVAPRTRIQTQRSLVGQQGLQGEVLQPGVAGGLIELEGILQIIAHPGHDQRVAVAGTQMSQRQHPGPISGIGRHQGGIGVSLIQIIHDRHRLEQGPTEAVDHQSRYGALGVDLQVGRVVLLSGQQVDRYFFECQSLVLECSAHPVGCQGSPKTIQFECHQEFPSDELIG